MHTSATREPPRTKKDRRRSVTDRLAGRMREATIFGTRIADISDELHRRRVPLHWTSMFGIVSAACAAVLVVTGLALMFFYTPSSDPTSYTGPYAPIHGMTASKAFDSTMVISFEVPGGLLLRQAHHWAALLLPAAIIMQLVTTFFTGGFRRPRRGMWVLLFLAFIAALAAGWSGYALPDDMLSGTGLRIVEGIVLGIPFIGTWLASALFGGSFPGRIIEHLYPLHIVVFPLAFIGFVVLRGLLAWRHGPPQFPGRGRSEENVVGLPLVPSAAARVVGLFLFVTALIGIFGATVTVSPIWLYGPSDPGNAGAGSQPDWYTGFLDGALRLVPPGWEVEWLGRTWTLAILAPLAVVGAYLLVMALYPFLEEWVTRDHRTHHLLDRPRNFPMRTAVGVAGIVVYGVLWAAGSADIIATAFSLSIEGVILALQWALLAGPIVAYSVAQRVCLGLQRKDRELLERGYETGRVIRLPGGEYVGLRRPLDETERARIEVPGLPRPSLPRGTGRDATATEAAASAVLPRPPLS